MISKGQKKPIYIIANAVIFPNRISGGDINFLELSKIWQEWGHPIYVVTTKEGKKMCLLHGSRANFILLPTIPPKLFGISLTYLFRTLLGAPAFLKHTKPNSILFSSSDFPPDILPALLAKIQCPSITWLISPNMIFPNPFRGYTKAFTRGFKLPSYSELLHFIAQKVSMILIKQPANKVIAISRQMGDFLVKKKGFPRKKVIYANYGVHIKKSQKLTPVKRGLYDGCFMGRFHPQKGIFELLEIWKEVTSIIPKANLAVIGGGPKKTTDKFLKKIKDYHLSKNIKLLGFKVGDERFRIIKSSRVFLIPSFLEGSPISLLEAMVCRIPVVAHDLPAFSQEFNKQGIITVPIGNTQEFAAAVVRLLKKPNLRKKLTRDSDQIIKKYDWQKVAKLILNSALSNTTA